MYWFVRSWRKLTLASIRSLSISGSRLRRVGIALLKGWPVRSDCLFRGLLEGEHLIFAVEIDDFPVLDHPGQMIGTL
jgi:hypothetical protein